MKLIIDIDSEVYKGLVIEGDIYANYAKDLIDSIKNGTPIPDNATNDDVLKALFDERGYRLHHWLCACRCISVRGFGRIRSKQDY